MVKELLGIDMFPSHRVQDAPIPLNFFNPLNPLTL